MIGKALGFVRAFGYASSSRAGRRSCMKYAAILEMRFSRALDVTMRVNDSAGPN